MYLPYNEFDMIRYLPQKKNLKVKMQGVDSVKAGECLDLCIVLDITGSMGSWMKRVKDTIKDIIDRLILDIF